MFVSGKQVSITDTYKCKEGGNFMFNLVFKIFETIKTLSMSNIIKLPDHLCFHDPAFYRKRLFSQKNP